VKPKKLYDNSRISDFKACPRKFMYRHIFDWRLTGSNIHLAFGSAWHAAMEVVWSDIKILKKEELAAKAYQAFLTSWTSDGFPAKLDYAMEEELSPKTPGRALEMIIAYIDHRAPYSQDFDVLYVERPFIVPLDPADDSLFYVGKIDKTIVRGSKIIGIEHKTTSAYAKHGGFRGGFLESFSPNSQVDGYIYALHLIFPENKIGGVWVDAALTHKEKEAFIFIPIEKQLAHLDSWLSDTKWWIEQIEHEKYKLSQAKPSDPYLRAFPKNTNSCWDFNSKCAFMDLCKSWPNPVGKDLPAGYIEEKWDPLHHIKGLDKILGTSEEVL
jgi:hypothetical protein